MTSLPHNGAAPPDPAAELCARVRALAQRLLQQGVAGLGPGLAELAAAEARLAACAAEVRGHEARRDEAAVQAGESMVRLRNAVDGLRDNRTQLVEGGLADDAMLADMDFQIGELEQRLTEAKQELEGRNRAIEGELGPAQTRCAQHWHERARALRALVGAVEALAPGAEPAELAAVKALLEGTPGG